MTKTEVIDSFRNHIQQNNLTHAYLLESENNEVLGDTVLEILLMIFCEAKTGCRECKNCHLILADDFIQVTKIGDGSRKIKKQEIVDLIAALNLGNIGLDQRKVYIIKNAEQLGNESGNSLLKTLEEPPTGAIAILLSQNRQEVLSTIRSRCKLFFIDDEFEALPENELVNIIKNGKKEDLFLFAARLRKTERASVIAILHDTLNKVILRDHIEMATHFYDAIYNIKKTNNFNLVVEDLIIKIFEVM